MSVLSFSHLVQVLKGMLSSPTDEERTEIFNEALLLTLAMATKSDTNISACEVETVQAVYKEETGEHIEAKDIRIAAISEVVEDKSLESMLAEARVVMDTAHQLRIIKALAAVIRADDKVSPFEMEFFNKVVIALGLNPSDLALQDV